MTIFDDGRGVALYVAGRFSAAGGVPANNIARWDGGQWSALGAGLDLFDASVGVQSLAVFDDGTGSALYATGTFDTSDLLSPYTGEVGRPNLV